MEKPINYRAAWEGVCLVGFGRHARDKLLPGLHAAGLKATGIVSAKPYLDMADVQLFRTVTDAISCLPKTTLFVVASPPNIHYSQVKALLEAGRDVFVEKPAFLSLHDSVKLGRLATQHKVVLAEMLMYLENKVVKQIIDELRCKAGSVKTIDCKFLIPSVPHGTFRTEASLGNSLLSDMACYPLSMLAIAGYDLSNLFLVEGTEKEKNSSIFFVKGRTKQADINIHVGCNGYYQNRVKIEFDDDREISCEPFFYGREGNRTLIKKTKRFEVVETVSEYNAYELMFLRKRPEWIATQKRRLEALKVVSTSLERLGKQAGLL
ncbi:Gfo/Idh/MocA family oxidoreductase [bacterium]|nr:Gfo/Idh/MocA family oxidoreductase [bacterium]